MIMFHVGLAFRLVDMKCLLLNKIRVSAHAFGRSNSALFFKIKLKRCNKNVQTLILFLNFTIDISIYKFRIFHFIFWVLKSFWLIGFAGSMIFIRSQYEWIVRRQKGMHMQLAFPNVFPDLILVEHCINI